MSPSDKSINQINGTVYSGRLCDYTLLTSGRRTDWINTVTESATVVFVYKARYCERPSENTVLESSLHAA